MMTRMQKAVLWEALAFLRMGFWNRTSERVCRGLPRGRQANRKTGPKSLRSKIPRRLQRGASKALTVSDPMRDCKTVLCTGSRFFWRAGVLTCSGDNSNL
jgi:hypothetical protein